MSRVWLRPGKKKPPFCELTQMLPVFSNFKVTVIIAEKADLVPAAYYVADRDYTRDPNIGVAESEAFTISSPTAGYSYIYIQPDASIGTIAHETYHAVTAMFEMIGAKEEHEIVAYHLGYLVNLIVAFNLKVAPRFKKGKVK